jgi:tRNA-modifying protein YgfZ
MTAELWQRLQTEGGWLNLSSRAKWRLSGPDRVRYLNGQVTQDVRLADACRALHACVTNAKGRIDGDVFFHAAPEGDSLLIDAPGALRESLGTRLGRYLIADDAELEDVSEDWQIWHRFGPDAGEQGLAANRLACAGRDLWLPAGVPAPVANPLTDDEAEILRILRAVPASPQELNGEVFPQEAGLEAEVMSFSKGCYVGQEVLSRIKSTGRMPRELAVWTAESGEPTAGASLWLSDGSRAGVITSCARHPVEARLQGLAFLRQGVALPDSQLLVGDAMTSISASLRIQHLSCR